LGLLDSLVSFIVKCVDAADLRLEHVVLGRLVANDAIQSQDWLLEGAGRHGGGGVAGQGLDALERE